MHPTSSYRDPVSLHNDRQKPDVAAPGTAMLSATTATPWIGDHFADGIEITGTSFSAPVVTGISAILMQRNNALRFWPEAVRAILMASATHNIEGSARSSDKDGAGGVEATWADYVAQRSVYGDWNGMAYNCSYPQNYTVKSVFLSQGDRLRAVIAWDNPTAYANYANQPSADLDLYLDNASGTPVSSSASYDGTSEIVDFSAPANGWYSIRVHKFRCDLSPNYLGWACEIIPYIG
jgi:subtilisin family serine protease